MTWTSLWFPVMCRYSVSHSGGCQPSLPGESGGRVSAWAHMFFSRLATSWGAGLPTQLAGVIHRLYLLISGPCFSIVLLFRQMQEVEERLIRQRDRQAGRCPGWMETCRRSFSCPKDPSAQAVALERCHLPCC